MELLDEAEKSRDQAGDFDNNGLVENNLLKLRVYAQSVLLEENAGETFSVVVKRKHGEHVDKESELLLAQFFHKSTSLARTVLVEVLHLVQRE